MEQKLNQLRKIVLLNVLAICLALAVIVLDQASKSAVTNYFLSHLDTTRIPVWGDYIGLIYTLNTGTAFGLMQSHNLTTLVIALTIACIIFYIFFFKTGSSLYLKTCLALIIGGAVGNVLDRIRLGYVVDFIECRIPNGPIFPIFNVADSAISIGIVALVIYFLFLYKPEKKEVISPDKVPEHLISTTNAD